MPKIVKLEELEDGQLLAETLVNKYDQILIKKGTPISAESHRRILKMWGIEEVKVYIDESESTSSPEQNEKREQVENKLLSKIEWEIENPNEKFLIDIAVTSQIDKGFDE